MLHVRVKAGRTGCVQQDAACGVQRIARMEGFVQSIGCLPAASLQSYGHEARCSGTVTTLEVTVVRKDESDG